MTSAGGAGPMAAAPGPRAGAEAEAEGRRRLLRSVTRLQACARGFLLRRRLRSVREEFEAVVLEIEGDLRQLRWSGRVLQRPRFGPEDAPGPVPAGSGAPGAARPAQPSPGKPSEPGEAAENKKRKNQEKPDPGGAERGGSCGNIPPPNPKNAKPPPKPPDLGCGAAETKTIPRKTREKLNPGGAERGGNIPPSAPLPRGTTPDPKNPKTTPKPPDLGCGAAESPEEEEEGALEWDSDSSELGASPGIPEELQGLPRWELQALRTQLLLELLWVQQAIASRKHFLLLKQKLGVPAHPSSIPEFLACCGEALEQQQQQQQQQQL